MSNRDTKGRYIGAGIRIVLDDQASGGIAALTKKLGDIKGSKAFELSANMRQSAANISQFSSGVVNAVKAPIQTFAKFESSMAAVRAKLPDTTKQAMAELEGLARKLGGETQFTAQQSATAMEALAQAGFDAKEIMGTMPGLLSLAAAGNVGLAEAADLTASSLRAFRMEASESGKVADILALSSVRANLDLTNLGESLTNVASTAASSGLDLSTTAAMVQSLANVGVKGGKAGTGIQVVLRTLSDRKKNRLIGDVKTADASGNLRDPVEFLEELAANMTRRFGADKKNQKRLDFLNRKFGEAGAPAVIPLLEDAESGKLRADVEANRKSQGQAATMAATMQNTGVGAMKELESAIEELQLKLGEQLLPKVTALVKEIRGAVVAFSDWAAAHPDLVANVAQLAGGMAVFGLVMGPIISGVAALVTVVGALAAVYRAVRVAWPFVVVGIKAIGLAIRANPLGVAITALAAGAAAIYVYWEPLAEFFTNLWTGIKNIAADTLDWIVDKIGYVGEKIESFRLSLMTEDAAAAYTATKEAEAVATARSLFGDDADEWANRSTLPSYTYVRPGAVANEAPTTMPNLVADFVKQGANWLAPGAAANGQPLQPMPPSKEKFVGELKIVVDGPVTGTHMRTYKDAAGFEVRVNKGAA